MREYYKSFFQPGTFTPSDLDPNWLVYSRTRLAGLLIIVGIVFFFRHPEAFFNTTFYAEDGAAFFVDAYQKGFWENLFYRHAGYPRIYLRLIAEVASWFPMVWTPYLYHWTTLVLTTTFVSAFYLPCFRRYVPSDMMRAGVCILIAFSPFFERLFAIAGLDWILLYALALMVLSPFPQSKYWQGFWFPFIFLAIFNTPLTIFLLPILLFRLIYSTVNLERMWVGFGTFCIAVNFALSSSLPSLQTESSGMLMKLYALGNAFVYRVIVTSITGLDTANQALKGGGWSLIYILAAILLVLLVVSLVKIRSFEETVPALLLGYLILGFYVPFIVRSNFVLHFTEIDHRTLYWHLRYFSISSWLFYILIAYLLCYHADRLRKIPFYRLVGIAIFVLIIFGQSTKYKMFHRTPVEPWAEQVQVIKNAERAANETGTPQKIELPIVPKGGWFIRMQIQPDKNSG